MVSLPQTNDRPPAAEAIIDVLIPAFNAGKTIRASIACIQVQTIAELRIIVVDDGSVDSTGSILAEMAASDPRIIMHRQPNRGIVDALNAALALSTAPFIARHDADDIAFPDRLARQLAYLNAHPDCVAVGSNAWHINADNKRTGTKTVFLGNVRPDADAIPAEEPYLMHPFLLMRRQALVDAGGYRYCFHAEDADLYWRLLGTGRLHNMTDVMGEYMIHEGSVSGASIINGRIAAKYSQLAALSYRRRQAGREDIVFKRDDLAIENQLDSFEQVICHNSDNLDNDELDYLKLASAAKLISLASYRPYVMSVADCAWLRKQLRDLRAVPRPQRMIIRRNQAEVLRRYIDARRWPQIAALRLPLAVYARLPKRYAWKIKNAIITKTSKHF